MTRAICGFLLLISCAGAQTVEGTVTNSVTNLPIQGVNVEVRQGSTVHEAITDGAGHFLFSNLADGAWTVQYASPDYSARPVRFQVTAGSPVKLEAKLTPKLHVAGRVVDGKGAPAPRAVVQMIGDSALWTKPADASGKFDFHEAMPADSYVLSASPPPGIKPPDPDSDGGRVLGWARTYYPGTVYRETASRLALGPGAELTGIELKLMSVPAHAVRGICLNPDGSPAEHVKVSLEQGMLSLPDTTASKSDGSFEFPAVVDAEWRLSAQAGELQAEQWLEATGRDVDGIKLRLAAPFTITGRVAMETPQGAPMPKPPQVRLHGRISANTLELGLGASGSEARMAADGSFVFDKMYPGVYSVHANPQKPYYLDSVRVGNAEVTTPDVEIPGPVSILLSYKTNGGGVRGTADGCGAGNVWLVPQEAGRRPGWFRIATCLEGGRYQFDAIRPGEYFLWASAGGVMRRPWIFGVFEEEILKQAAKVTVRPGEVTSLDVSALLLKR